MLNTDKKCDFCQTQSLAHHYTPIQSARGMEVMVCKSCGLIQSISTKAYPSRPAPSMSANADRSSIRYTKDLVLNAHTEIIEKYVDLKNRQTILDVGANRGAFVNWLRKHYPGRNITAVEPDGSVVDNYATLPNIDMHVERFENVNLKPKTYDFAHCVHTLEHADSAAEMFLGIARSLKPGGIFFLVVPNAPLVHEDAIEEVFIDTHTYHFNWSLLRAFALENGFDLIYESTEGHPEIIFILKRNNKELPQHTFVTRSKELYAENVSFLNRYRELILTNRKTLKIVSDNLHRMAQEQKMVIWGAGRIFDALVLCGGLDPKRISFLVDRYLCKYSKNIHGVALHSPDILADHKDEKFTLFIASREFVGEILEQSKFLVNATKTSFVELMKDSHA